MRQQDAGRHLCSDDMLINFNSAFVRQRALRLEQIRAARANRGGFVSMLRMAINDPASH